MSKNILYEPSQIIGPYGVKFLYETSRRTQPCGKQVRRAIFECPYCGKEFEATIAEVNRGNIRSCGCYRVISKLKTHAKDLAGVHNQGMLTAIKRTNKKGPDNSYIWECLCDCGNITYVSVSDFFDTQSCGCLLFHSGGEQSTKRLLNKYNINYKTEYHFIDCKSSESNQYLRFDFYLPEINTCIEIDGRQHREPVSRFGGEKTFNILKKHDRIKDEYCRINEIKLIRIPYNREPDFDSIVLETLIREGVIEK